MIQSMENVQEIQTAQTTASSEKVKEMSMEETAQTKENMQEIQTAQTAASSETAQEIRMEETIPAHAEEKDPIPHSPRPSPVPKGKIMAFSNTAGSFDTFYSIRKLMLVLSGKDFPNVLILPTANGDEFSTESKIYQLFSVQYHLPVKVLRLLAQGITESYIQECTSWADIIFVPGGNLKLLMDTWRRTGADRCITQAYMDGALLAGGSSGAMCWFSQGYDNPTVSDGLGLIPYILCPHFDDPQYHLYAERAKMFATSSICLDNGAVLVYAAGNYFTLRGKDGGHGYFIDADNGYEITDMWEHPEVCDRL